MNVLRLFFPIDSENWREKQIDLYQNSEKYRNEDEKNNKEIEDNDSQMNENQMNENQMILSCFPIDQKIKNRGKISIIVPEKSEKTENGKNDSIDGEKCDEENDDNFLVEIGKKTRIYLRDNSGNSDENQKFLNNFVEINAIPEKNWVYFLMIYIIFIFIAFRYNFTLNKDEDF